MNTNNTQISFGKFRTVLALISIILVSGHVCSKNLSDYRAPINKVEGISAPGAAVDFDGTKDYIAVTSSFPSFTNFTFSAWVNLRTFPNSKLISASSYEIGIKYGQLVMWVDPWEDELIGTLSFKTNEWAYVAVTSDGSIVKFYINGELDKTFTRSTQLPAASAMNIGKHARLNVNYLDGKIDELKLESVTRTPEEIKASMFNVVPANTAGLVAYYRFDEGTPAGENVPVTTLTDLTGNNHNGALTNFTMEGTTSNFVESYAMVVPVAITASNVSSAGFTANWTASVLGTVDNYLLDVSSSSDFSTFVTGYEALNVNSATTYNVTQLEANTTYYYRVRANKSSAGLGASSNIIPVSTVLSGINDVENVVFSICPNPSKGEFSVASDKKVRAIEVLDITGKLILKTTAVSDRTSIDLSNQAKGIYFVRVAFDDSVKTQRVCIE